MTHQNPHQKAFLESLDSLEDSQRELLQKKIIHPNITSTYGTRYEFGSVDSAERYRETVPLVGYEDIRSDVESLEYGSEGVLTSERTVAFFKTSGSMSLPKLIPVTNSLMREKVAAFATFWGQVYDRYPAIRDGAMVSNFSDASTPDQSAAGIEITSESGFWARRGRSLHSMRRWPLPAEIRSIDDSDARQYATARLLLQSDLHCIMCLNPSTLLQFCRVLENSSSELVDGLEQGVWGASDKRVRECLESASSSSLREHLIAAPDRALRLQSAVADGRVPQLVDLWPELDLVICWCSSVVQPYFIHLKPYLAGVAVRDYITQSSECMMAIPFEDEQSGGALAYQSHFFEFIPEAEAETDKPHTRFAWELEVGGRYEIVVSTGGGLYRYRMGDCVQVNGFRGHVPVIEFLYRLGKTSSMTGEKLTEFQVIDAASHASSECQMEPEEYLLYPCSGLLPHYGLLFDPGHMDFLDQQINRWVAAFDRHLGEVNSEYRDKCNSNRLGPIHAYRVAPGDLRRLRHARKASGVSEEQIKSEVLTRRTDLHLEQAVVSCPP